MKRFDVEERLLGKRSLEKINRIKAPIRKGVRKFPSNACNVSGRLSNLLKDAFNDKSAASLEQSLLRSK